MFNLVNLPQFKPPRRSINNVFWVNIFKKMFNPFVVSSVWKSVILLGFFACLGNATPLENHLQLSSEPHYDTGNPWIGSHELKFTPNPFLLNTDFLLPLQVKNKHLTHQNAALSDPNNPSTEVIVVSTGESPILPELTTQTPWDPFNNYVTTQPKMGKRGRKLRRKVKGRRRLSPTRSNKAQRNPASRYKSKGYKLVDNGTHKRRFITMKPRGKVLIGFSSPMLAMADRPITNDNEDQRNGRELSNDFGKVDFFPIDKASINPPLRYKWKGLKSTQSRDLGHSLLIPTVTTAPPAAEEEEPPTTTPTPVKAEGVEVRITPPPPIMPKVIESKDNLIPIDLILNHADKLNPSFFRNIIMKTMMEKLAEVEVAKNGPKLATRSSEKEADPS